MAPRAREEAVTRGSRAGMLHALGAVGLAQIGVLICIGVLLDTLLIRTVLVPAIALVLGDRFWWPRRIEQGARHA
ncbi:MAG: MMPL family transporter [Aeromicrobium sp.]